MFDESAGKTVTDSTRLTGFSAAGNGGFDVDLAGKTLSLQAAAGCIREGLPY